MSALVNWALIIFLVGVPVLVAVFSPLLDSREAIYRVGGLAGVAALALLLIQPLLAIGYFKTISRIRQRRMHLWTGALLVLAVFMHIYALYLTSPDDMMDALFLRSATPFSIYGFIGMMGIVLITILVTLRKKINIPFKWWKVLHATVGVLVVLASVVHALWIQGTMGTVSKWMLCGTILIATGFAVFKLEVLQAFLKNKNN